MRGAAPGRQRSDHWRWRPPATALDISSSRVIATLSSCGTWGTTPAGVVVILAVLLDGACAGWYRCRGDGVVDEDCCDGGGGGEGVGVEDSAAGRGAIQEQRQLLAELFGVGGAGLAGILLVGLARNGAGFDIALGAEVL